VLSAADEAYASYLGVANSTSISDGAIIDLGGGSLEFMAVEHRKLMSARSVPLGAIYATERFLASDPPSRKEIRALREAVREQVDIRGPVPVLYGAGGGIRNLARITRLRRRHSLRRLHGFEIERDELLRLRDSLVSVDAAGRRKIPGVNASRARFIHAAAIVVAEVMDVAGADKITVSGQGLREGLAWQELRGELPLIENVRAASIAQLATANGVNVAVAEAVVETAEELFDATAPLHKLDESYRELLSATARIASIGAHVDFYDRDRHAQYLVDGAGLHGFSHREIALLGALVRSADGGSVDLSACPREVNSRDLRAVTVLSALVGLARAIHRRPAAGAVGVEAELRGKVLRLTLGGRGPRDAEVITIERQRTRFEAALGVRLRLQLPGN
jgi:exopolyphosphatase/guanosine-5'-triphosphate,3'-diphosphate pyrophosphatase